MVFQKGGGSKPKPAPATTDAGLFEQEAHASQLEQYDDITLRNMEVINLYTAMQNGLVFGAANSALLGMLKEFHLHFGGLYGSTYLESEKYLEIPYKETGATVGQKVKSFLSNPLIGQFRSGHINNPNPNNRAVIENSIKNALDVFDIYEAAIQKAGYRKTTFKKMKQSEKWRENF